MSILDEIQEDYGCVSLIVLCLPFVSAVGVCQALGRLVRPNRPMGEVHADVFFLFPTDGRYCLKNH